MSEPRDRVAVIGLGYVGLPLAALCARRGYSVIGLDINEKTVESLAAGNCHIRDEVVEKSFAEAMASGNLSINAHPSTIVVDGRNFLDGDPIRDRGLLYRGIGLSS